MKTTVNKSQFKDAFRACNRQDQFSYEGLGALFDWIEDMDESCGTETELDVIALCCDFSEHETAFDCLKDYMTDDQFIDEFVSAMAEGDDELEQACLEYLRENTLVIEFGGGIIIQAF